MQGAGTSVVIKGAESGNEAKLYFLRETGGAAPEFAMCYWEQLHSKVPLFLTFLPTSQSNHCHLGQFKVHQSLL